MQFKSRSLVEVHGFGYEAGNFRTRQKTLAQAGVEVLIHARGIPAKEGFLFMPRQRAFGGKGLGNDRRAFSFETQQKIFGKGTSQPEGYKIGGSLAFQMGEVSARVKTGY